MIEGQDENEPAPSGSTTRREIDLNRQTPGGAPKVRDGRVSLCG